MPTATTVGSRVTAHVAIEHRSKASGHVMLQVRDGDRLLAAKSIDLQRGAAMVYMLILRISTLWCNKAWAKCTNYWHKLLLNG